MIARATLGLVAFLGAPPVGAEPFVVKLPEVNAAAAPSSYDITLPEISASSVQAVFAISTPPVTANARPSEFAISVPLIAVQTNRSDYVVTMPAIDVRARQAVFSVTLPSVAAQSSSAHFEVAMPKVAAAAFRGDDAGDDEVATDQSLGQDLTCTPLLQCFPELDIRSVENDLRSLGYTVETYPAFCADVAQSLGDCLVAVENVPNTPGLAAPRPADLDPQATGLNFNRCRPLEDYAITLQDRSDAGDDTSAEERALMALIMAASNHMLSGRADLWCDEISAGLP